ncbi:MAG: CDP-diacylglycerol--glycerol-3-phosphate 3-phosphatidyltransferase [Streptococcaceae bacterium]|jgi:CDP-diacylglycerol--glycerol-3-phosphate 3-phosphatidyltransferase|nr:CDP-diacylglycerol--glycerol-3-phosphate 3-phosphatidyltransferase [Streptococcaceae bacterium]
MNLPNKLTVLRILMIPLFLFMFSFPFDWGEFKAFSKTIPLAHIVAAIIFILATITDWLDGYLARKWHLVTNFGKFADPLADKMLIMAAFIVLIELKQVSAWIVAIIVIRELAVTGLRLLVVEKKGEVLGAAWPGKIKTITQMLAIIFLLLHNLPMAFVTNLPIGEILLYIALTFTIYSGVDYFVKNKEVFKESM